jgi:Galactose oxidase, central domain
MPGVFWTQEQDIGPSGRAGHAMAFDAARHRVVLFGGDSPRSAFLADTWAWDGENWTQVADTGPSPRTGHQLAFDGPRSRVVLFGGRAGPSVLHGDTWEWDGENWTQVADSGPDARTGHQLAFDDQRARVVLFGGEAADASVRRDTWEWDGKTWTQREDIGPPARRQHAMTFDSARKRVVLFGGDLGTTTAGDTWEWDGTSWTQVADTGPDPCAGAAMAFDGAGALLFGGTESLAASKSPPRLFGLTWEWDGQHWTARQDIGPAPRWGHAIAFDSDRGRPVLFGGLPVPPGDPNAPNHALADTWETSLTGTAPSRTTPAADVQLTAFALNPDTVSLGGVAGGPGVPLITVAVGLDRPAPTALTVSVNTPALNVDGQVGIPAGATAAQASLSLPGAMMAVGDYLFEAQLGSSSRSAMLHVLNAP